MNLRLLGLMSLVAAFSCRDKSQVDVKAPTIESLTINGSNDNSMTLAASSTIDVAYSLKDNIDLANCTLSIHPASNGHSHTGDGSHGGENKLPSGPSWSVQETTPVSGSTHSGQKSIQIPDSVAGIWHVEVIGVDAVGQSASRAISLTVTNSNLPVISITSCSPEISSDGMMHLTAGTPIHIVAMANDPNNLASVYIKLFDGQGNSIHQQSVPVSGTTVNFPANFTNTAVGTYRIVLDATDILGYRAIWDVPVKVQ